MRKREEIWHTHFMLVFVTQSRAVASAMPTPHDHRICMCQQCRRPTLSKPSLVGDAVQSRASAMQTPYAFQTPSFLVVAVATCGCVLRVKRWVWLVVRLSICEHYMFPSSPVFIDRPLDRLSTLTIPKKHMERYVFLGLE